jgi:hypothetical protein
MQLCDHFAKRAKIETWYNESSRSSESLAFQKERSLAPRIRTIKPDFFAHEGLADLSVHHRLLFIGLWTLSDRRGRLLDRPRRIKIACFPYDTDITAENISFMLDELAAHPDGFVVRYECRGRDYIEIPGFLEHQRPHHKEPESSLPGSTGKDVSVHEPSMNHARVVDESSTKTQKSIHGIMHGPTMNGEGKGMEGKGNGRERKGMEGKSKDISERPEEIFALRSHEDV